MAPKRRRSNKAVEETAGKLRRIQEHPKAITNKEGRGDADKQVESAAGQRRLLHNHDAKEAKVSLSQAAPYLTDDLLDYGILPHLSAKALMRMNCVCKRWQQIISNPPPGFVHMQSHHAASGIIRFQDLTVLSKDPRSIGVQKPIYPCTYPAMKRIAASCKGLLCIENGATILIGNPSFHNSPSWEKLPPPRIKSCRRSGYQYPVIGWVKLSMKYEFPIYGLAVDVEESVIHYKLVVLHTISFNNLVSCIFQIFSSLSKQWSLAKERPELPSECLMFDGHAVYAEGSLYRKLLSGGDAFWFNPKDEVCGLQPLPPGAGDNPKHGEIGECRGRLSYVAIMGNRLKMWSLEKLKWLMTLSINIGNPTGRKLVPLSILQHRMNMRSGRCSQSDIPVYKELTMMPFEGGDFFSFSLNGFLHCYDTFTGEFHKLTERRKEDLWFPYKNSIVLPRGGNTEESIIKVLRLRQYA